MIAGTPSSAVRMADEAFNHGDIDGMLAFYEEDATMLFAPNEILKGKAALRQALCQLSAMKLVAKHHKSHVIEAGDIALWVSNWSVAGMSADSSPISRHGSGSTVLRKGSDGGWRVAIENPWGAASLDFDTRASN
jgi:ketosteroid isomerase-like protein